MDDRASHPSRNLTANYYRYGQYAVNVRTTELKHQDANQN